MYPGFWTWAEVLGTTYRWVKIDLQVKDWGEKHDMKDRIEWWSHSWDLRIKSKQSSSAKTESWSPGIKHWNRKQSSFGMEGRGLILEFLRHYKELLNVLENLDKKAEKKFCLVPAIETYTGEKWDGVIWLPAEIFFKIIFVAQVGCQCHLDPFHHT